MFKSSRTPRNLQVSTKQVPSMSSAMPNSNTKGLRQKRLPLDLLTNDVAKISRCVCCSVQWTARKSGAQKMTHIQSCAKKYALDDGTVNLLIQKEISSKEPFVKKTFFEDVLVDAAPKQKVKRRKKEESSLKTVSVSRDSILARAQGVLSTTTDDCKYRNGSTFAGSTQGHSELPLTQAFGRSGLAQMQTLEYNTFPLDDHCPNISDDDAGSDQGAPEAQPAFLASSLASRPLKVFGDYESVRKVTRPAGDLFGDESEVEDSHILRQRNDQLVTWAFVDHFELILPLGARVPRTPTPDSSPELSVLTHLTIHSPTPTSQSKKIRKPKKGPDVPSHSDGPSPSTDRVTPKKKIGPRKKISSKLVHQFDEKWQLHMMRNIFLDSDLHLRILRYEPIHFNIFLEIAARYAPPNGKLKRHLRTFLDGQSIIFYGEATMKRRR
ncbi:hypothetical protein BYT27DRAFT_7252092 [Phlegmacium glaucopus]|nr:hypothetical protein BYT27DRAFT_7252092 [Phlegmacium glaucopus]